MDYRKVVEGEYWDIANSDGMYRRIGKKESDISYFIEQQKKVLQYFYEKRLNDLTDFELRMKEKWIEDAN